MSDPRNVAHAKKVTQEKKHQAAKKTRGPGPTRVAPVAEATPTEASAAPSESATPMPSAALEASNTVLAKLKEMEFYSRANLEHLAELVLTVGDELKQKDVAAPLDEVYSAQNTVQTKLTALIEAYKAECGRLQGESA